MFCKKNFLSLIILTPLLLSAQNKISGLVTDSLTKQPIPFVSVYFKGSTFGAMTDNSGKFLLSIPLKVNILEVSSVGYRKKTINISNLSKLINLKIQLCQSAVALNEFIVKPKREKYKKKGNPAVEFVRKVIAEKDKFNPYNKPYFHYRHYEKISIALNNFHSSKKKGLFGRFSNSNQYVDYSMITGKPVLPISTKELIEQYYYRKSPRSVKTIIEAKKSAGIDQMLSEDGVEQFLNDVFKNIDIYDNDIHLFLKTFVSPLSTGGPDFYKYYLLDTLQINGQRCVDLGFVPFVSESTGFTGHLYITLDSVNFVKKVQLNLPRDINLNFIQYMLIEQNFDRAADGTRLLKKDEVAVEFSVFTKAKGFYARRTNLYSQYSFSRPMDSKIFSQPEASKEDTNASSQPDSYWKTNRPDSAQKDANSVDRMLTQFRQNPLFYYSEKVFSALVTGYISTSSTNNLFSLGPMYSTISLSSFEGLRVRVGGFTTAKLNDHWFGNGYLAYGTKDKRLKYNAVLEYSFNKKKEQANEFPIHSLRFSYNYDLNRLGQQYLYSTSDNLFLSLKRQPDTKIDYIRNVQLSYNNEFYTHFAFGVDFRYRTEYASTYVPFINVSTGQSIEAFNLGAVELKMRYAPGEKFYQTFSKRHNITRDAPVFSLSHISAMKGILNSSYTYNRTELGFQKRFWFSAYGNANIILKAGKVWNKVPFPLLIIPNANLSYTIQYESYSQMNAMEFINDQYVSWDANYNMNGWLLNRIPFLKKLKLREILSFRGLYGSLSKQNNPAYSPNLYRFPTGSYTMGKLPYMEAVVGVENIFKCLRIDYVWRLNYLNHPNIEKSGLRVSLDFTF